LIIEQGITVVEGVNHSPTLFAEAAIRAMDNGHPRIRERGLIGEFTRAVRGTVVHNNPTPRADGLGHHGGDGFGKAVLLVANGSDNDVIDGHGNGMRDA
jgi:hypothetical protein